MSPLLLSILRLLAAPLLLAPAIQAGNVLRVGAGQPFATVQDAVDAASSGDLVLVDPGSYPPFTVDGKDLAIAASSGSFSLAPTAGVPEITVRNVALGDIVTIIGARIGFDDPGAPAMLVSGNPGAVRLSGLVVDQVAPLIGASVQAAVVVEGTATFWLGDSSIWGPVQLGNTTNPLCAGSLCNDGISGLQMTDSEGVIQDSRMRGYYNDDTIGPVGCGGDGLRVIGASSAWLVADVSRGSYPARFKGGDGIYGGHAVHQVRTPPNPALIQSCGGGGFTPSYEPGKRLVAGIGALGGFYGFNNTNGSAPSQPPGHGIAFKVVDHCGLDENNESPLASSTVPLGGTLTVLLRTYESRRYLTCFSDWARYAFAHRRFAGRPLIDPTRILATVSGTTAAQTTTPIDVPIPSSPALIGFQVTVQSLTGPAGGPLDAVSTPSFAVIVP